MLCSKHQKHNACSLNICTDNNFSEKIKPNKGYNNKNNITGSGYDKMFKVCPIDRINGNPKAIKNTK